MRTAICAFSLVSSKGHAMAVMRAPEVAPAAPKQVMVERLGRAWGVLACSRGEEPVAS